MLKGFDIDGKCVAKVRDQRIRLWHVFRLVRGARVRGIEIKSVRCW